MSLRQQEELEGAWKAPGQSTRRASPVSFGFCEQGCFTGSSNFVLRQQVFPKSGADFILCLVPPTHTRHTLNSVPRSEVCVSDLRGSLS